MIEGGHPLYDALAKFGIEDMTTFRDLQASLVQALEEIKVRNDSIQELYSKLAEKDVTIAELNHELQLLKAVLENPLASHPAPDTIAKKRIAISAAPVSADNPAGSTSYAKYPAYVSPIAVNPISFA